MCVDFDNFCELNERDAFVHLTGIDLIYFTLYYVIFNQSLGCSCVLAASPAPTPMPIVMESTKGGVRSQEQRAPLCIFIYHSLDNNLAVSTCIR